MFVSKVVNLIAKVAVLGLLAFNTAGAADQFNTFDDWLKSNMSQQKVSGVSLAIIDHGQIVYTKSYSTNRGIKVTPDSYFQSNDLIKSILTVTLLRLSTEGKLNLDDHLSQFDIQSKLTVRQLLMLDEHNQLRYSLMRGLNANLPSLAKIMEKKTNLTLNLIDYYSYQRPTRLKTSNSIRNLQLLHQAATKQGIEFYLNSSVLTPLMMKRSRVIMQAPVNLPTEQAASPLHAVLSPAGLWTTASDIARFLLATLENRPTYNAISELTANGYSLGFDKDRCHLWIPHLEKLTDSNGVNNYVMLLPETEQGIVILTNSNHSVGLIKNVVDEIAKQYHWPFSPNLYQDMDERQAVAACKSPFYANNTDLLNFIQNRQSLPIVSVAAKVDVPDLSGIKPTAIPVQAVVTPTPAKVPSVTVVAPTPAQAIAPAVPAPAKVQAVVVPMPAKLQTVAVAAPSTPPEPVVAPMPRPAVAVTPQPVLPPANTAVTVVPLPEIKISNADLKSCRQLVSLRCSAKSGLGYYHCAMNTLYGAGEQCNVTYRVMEETGGMPIRALPYHAISVVKVKTNASAGNFEYFIIPPQGSLLSLSSSIDLSQQPMYNDLLKQYPKLSLMALADGFPASKVIDNKTQLIFSQRITEGCEQCTPLAHAYIAYEFNDAGKLLKTFVVNIG